jgi:hypothetical protein
VDVTDEADVDEATVKLVGELRVKTLRTLPALVGFHVAKEKEKPEETK